MLRKSCRCLLPIYGHITLSCNEDCITRKRLYYPRRKSGMDLCEGFCVFLTVVKGRNEVLAVMELGL